MGKKLPRVKCPKCGVDLVECRARGHADNGWCVSIQNLKALREQHGLDVPSNLGASFNTVQMLAKHAGIELEKEPVGCYDYGKKWREASRKKTPDGLIVNQRYMVAYKYVAPTWLIRLAVAWRRGRYFKKGAPFPKRILERLPDAVNSERLQGALIAHLTLQRRT